ncbi:DUF4192 domain-containing protein [Actinoplanes sp. HUAS TT8]|uniref:DUF4192 domain-containing protein n=1 Tax=Actinoplanes sp. HUAS TT8 TaxID=3447453 RepID=UPI003F51B54B
MLESAFLPRKGDADQLVGLVPHMLGYHPTDALIAVINRPDQPLPQVISLPLSEPTGTLLTHLTLRIPEKARGTVLIGYGPAIHRPKITAVSEVLEFFTPVFGRFLYDDGVLTCLTPDCDCAAAGGVPVDPRSTRIAAELALTGRVALPSGEEVHALVAPDDIGQAEIQAALDTIDEAAPPADVESLMRAARNGERLTADQVARMCLALHDREQLVTAWHYTRGRHWQHALWLDVTRRAPQQHVAAPASLAAWSAWRRGQDALAVAALDRARAIAPGDGFTRIVGYLVDAHLPAHRLRWPLAKQLDAPPTGSHP